MNMNGMITRDRIYYATAFNRKQFTYFVLKAEIKHVLIVRDVKIITLQSLTNDVNLFKILVGFSLSLDLLKLDNVKRKVCIRDFC